MREIVVHSQNWPRQRESSKRSGLDGSLDKMKALFKIPPTAVLVLVTMGVLFQDASAWLSPFSKERIRAAGKYCVHGYDGNFGTVGTYYAGDAVAFNAQIAAHFKLGIVRRADELEVGGDYVTRTVVLHPGSKVVPRYLDKTGKLSTDWLVTSWRGDLAGEGGWHLRVDVWLGDRIKLDELRIPQGYAVKSGREIEDFVARHNSNAKGKEEAKK